MLLLLVFFFIHFFYTGFVLFSDFFSSSKTDFGTFEKEIKTKKSLLKSWASQETVLKRDYRAYKVMKDLLGSCFFLHTLSLFTFIPKEGAWILIKKNHTTSLKTRSTHTHNCFCLTIKLDTRQKIGKMLVRGGGTLFFGILMRAVLHVLTPNNYPCFFWKKSLLCIQEISTVFDLCTFFMLIFQSWFLPWNNREIDWKKSVLSLMGLMRTDPFGRKKEGFFRMMKKYEREFYRVVKEQKNERKKVMITVWDKYCCVGPFFQMMGCWSKNLSYYWSSILSKMLDFFKDVDDDDRRRLTTKSQWVCFLLRKILQSSKVKAIFQGKEERHLQLEKKLLELLLFEKNELLDSHPFDNKVRANAHWCSSICIPSKLFSFFFCRNYRL